MERRNRTEASVEIEKRKLRLDERRQRAEAGFRREELRLKKAELDVRSRELNDNRFVLFGRGVPGLAVTLVVGIIAAFAALTGAFVQGSQNRALEHEKFTFQTKQERQKVQSDLVLNALKDVSPDEGLKRLRTMMAAGLLDPSSSPVAFGTLRPGWTPVGSSLARTFGTIEFELPKDRYAFYGPLSVRSDDETIKLADKVCRAVPVLNGRFVVYDVVQDPAACHPNHIIYAYDAASRCVKSLEPRSSGLVSVSYGGFENGKHRLYLEEFHGEGPGPPTFRQVYDGLDAL